MSRRTHPAIALFVGLWGLSANEVSGGAQLVSPGGANWAFSQDKDEMTDATVSYAASRSGRGLETKSIVVECDARKQINAYVAVGAFLGDGSHDVEFRFDKEPASGGKWSGSTDGTAAFVDIDSRIGFVRKLISSSQVSVRITDYQGTPHTAIFPLAGSAGPVSKTLNACGRSAQSPFAGPEFAGVSDRVKLSVEEWETMGIEYTIVSKEILAALKFYKGPIDGAKSSELLQSLQRFEDDFLERCEQGRMVNADENLFCIRGVPGATERIGVSAHLGASAPDDLKRRRQELVEREIAKLKP